MRLADDDIDFTITSSRPADDDIYFAVTDSRPADDDIDFTITISRPADDDIDFTVADSRPADDDIDFTVTSSRPADDDTDDDIDFNVTDSRVADDESISKRGLFATAKKVRGKYEKSKKQKNVDFVADVQETLANKNARIASQKISKKYDNIRRKRKSERSPEPIQIEIKRPRKPTCKGSKLARIAATRTSKKYRTLRSKTPRLFNLADLADAEAVVCTNDTDLKDVSSAKGMQIATNKI